MRRRGFLKMALGALAGVVGLRRAKAEPFAIITDVDQVTKTVTFRSIPTTDETDWGADVTAQIYLLESHEFPEAISARWGRAFTRADFSLSDEWGP